jgi:Flp pilus assembly protein TadD
MPHAIEKETFESRDLFGRAEVQIKRGRFREASVLITQALKMAPDNPVYISYLGYCIGSLGNVDAAEKMCRRAMQLAPTLPIVLVNLGRILVEKGLRKEARVLLAQAYSIDNTNAPAALELSRLGVRRPPVFPFLKRNNFMNKYAGILRHRLLELLNARNNRIL